MAKELKGILKSPRSTTRPSPLRKSVTFDNKTKIQKVLLERKCKRKWTPRGSIPQISDNASVLNTNVRKPIGTCASNSKRGLSATTPESSANTLVSYSHSIEIPPPQPMSVQTGSSKPTNPVQSLTAKLEAIIDANLVASLADHLKAKLEAIIDANLAASLADHLKAKLEANIKVQKCGFMSWRGLTKVNSASKKRASHSFDEQNLQ